MCVLSCVMGKQSRAETLLLPTRRKREMQLISALIIIQSPTGAFGWRPDKKGRERNQRMACAGDKHETL